VVNQCPQRAPRRAFRIERVQVGEHDQRSGPARASTPEERLGEAGVAARGIGCSAVLERQTKERAREPQTRPRGVLGPSGRAHALRDQAARAHAVSEQSARDGRMHGGLVDGLAQGVDAAQGKRRPTSRRAGKVELPRGVAVKVRGDPREDLGVGDLGEVVVDDMRRVEQPLLAPTQRGMTHLGVKVRDDAGVEEGQTHTVSRGHLQQRGGEVNGVVEGTLALGSNAQRRADVDDQLNVMPRVILGGADEGTLSAGGRLPRDGAQWIAGHIVTQLSQLDPAAAPMGASASVAVRDEPRELKEGLGARGLERPSVCADAQAAGLPQGRLGEAERVSPDKLDPVDHRVARDGERKEKADVSA